MFTLSDQALNADNLKAQVINNRSGGFVSFEGWVRNHNHNKSVQQLDYQAHDKLATQVGNEILDEAREQFAINEAVCSHRVGLLKVGDMAIWVGVSADHREAAFAACQYILNQTKARVPIWKNEHYSDGETGWVEANL